MLTLNLNKQYGVKTNSNNVIKYHCCSLYVVTALWARMRCLFRNTYNMFVNFFLIYKAPVKLSYWCVISNITCIYHAISNLLNVIENLKDLNILFVQRCITAANIKLFIS